VFCGCDEINAKLFGKKVINAIDVLYRFPCQQKLTYKSGWRVARPKFNLPKECFARSLAKFVSNYTKNRINIAGMVYNRV